MVLSGMSMKRIKVNVKWIRIIKDLFNEKEENIRKYDDYVYSSFQCFVKHKRKLKIVMPYLSECNMYFRNMIMGQLVKVDISEDIEIMKGMINGMKGINLPKKQVLRILHNIQQLELDLYDYIDNKLYIISLSSLLSNITSHPTLNMVKIRLGYASKIRSLYSLSQEMTRKYEKVGFDINLEQDEYNNIYCMIKRKS